MKNFHLIDMCELRATPLKCVARCFDDSERQLYELQSDGTLISRSCASGDERAIGAAPALAETPFALFFQRLRDRALVVSPRAVAALSMTGNWETLFEATDAPFIAAALSPSADWLVLATATELLSLDRHLALEHRATYTSEPASDCRLAFRGDSQIVCASFQTGKGRRAMCFSALLEGQNSPTTFDPKYPEVTNVFETPNAALLPPFAFSSDGWLIAGLNGGAKPGLVFWEKNGLVYSREKFSSAKKVWKIQFCVGTSLAAFVEKRRIWFLFRANAKWETKYLLNIPTEIDDFFFIGNDEFVVYSAAAVLRGRFRLANNVFAFETRGQRGNALTFFIGNESVSGTPFDTILLPHPDSLFEQRFSAQPIAFAFEKDLLAVLTADNCVQLLRLRLPAKAASLPSIELDSVKYARHFTLCNEVLLFVDGERSTNLIAIDLSTEDRVVVELNLSDSQRVVWSGRRGDETILVTNTEVLVVDLKEKRLRPELGWLPRDDIAQLSFGGARAIPVTLTNNGLLYVGDALVARDCTSFKVFDEYLAYTVVQSTPFDRLYLVSISEPVLEVPSEPDCHFWPVRPIEKGATLLAVTGARLIFELPRGNLETIYPRILVAKEVRLAVSIGEYAAALRLLQEHRMNLSIALEIDLDAFSRIPPADFLARVPSDLFDLLVADISDEFADELRFVRTPGEHAAARAKAAALLGGVPKTRWFVDRFLPAFDRGNAAGIRSTLLCLQRTGRLRAALRLIAELRAESPETPPQQAPHIPPTPRAPTYHEHLSYLCWLCSAETLYSTALLMQDLDLAKLVAEFTRRDPREYLPRFEELQAMSDIKRRVTVCLELGRPEKAIKALAKGDAADFEQARALANRHELHSKVFKYFAQRSNELAVLRRDFGFWLFARDEHKLALPYLIEASATVEVLTCCEKTLDWKSGDAYLRARSDDSHAFLAKMAAIFERLGAHKALSKVLRAMGAPIDERARALLRAGEYSAVQRLLAEPGASLATRSAISTDVGAAGQSEAGQLRARAGAILQRRARLVSVQQSKAAIVEELVDDRSVSNRSQTGFTDGSVRSGMSAFGRQRPRNLKQRKVREGSPFEEEWLIEQLNGECIAPSEETRLAALLSLLLFLDLHSIRNDLQTAVREFLVLIERKPLLKTIAQQSFEAAHPELTELYGHLQDFNPESLRPSKSQSLAKLRRML